MNTIPFEKSFASHSKAKFWSTKNTGLPADYALNSHKKCWFDCDCGHSFESTLLNINQSNNWCGYCSNPPKLLCSNICVPCENKSFALHPKSACWSNENEIDPRQVFKNADSAKNPIEIKIPAIKNRKFLPSVVTVFLSLRDRAKIRIRSK